MSSFFNFFSRRPSAGAAPAGSQDAGEDCCICLQALKARSGVPVMTPGCCGKFFHQDCIDGSIASGITTCPHCVQPLPPRLLNAANPVVQRPQRVLVPPSSVGSSLKRYLGESGTPREDLLDPVVEAGAPPFEVTGAPEMSPLILSSTPERNEVSFAAQSNFYINVNLAAGNIATSSQSSRVPMDIVCVLDNSGSMQGTKIQSLKVAMEFIRTQLSNNDRLSVISFNSRATVEHGLFRMTGERKLVSEDICNRISANGGTDIFSGLNCAATILDSRQTVNKLSCVFLLTDGQDNSNIADKKALAARMKAKGQALFTFGFGVDHDAAQLQMIANAAEGQFIYVEHDDMVTDAFGGAIGGQQGTLATDIDLTVSLPEAASLAGVRLVRATAGRYATRTNRNGSITVSFANLFAGEKRDVLCVVDIPACSEVQRSQELLNASAQFTGLDGNRHAARVGAISSSVADSSSASAYETLSTICTCSVARDETPAAEANVDVDAQKNRARTMEALTNAMEAADRGEMEKGNAILRSCLAEIEGTVSYLRQDMQVMSSVEDIVEAIQKTASAREYSRQGGKAAMCEQMSNISAQRSAYSKSTKRCKAYQNSASVAMQESATVYKSAKKGFF